MESPLDHVFVNYQVNIVQSCDQCSYYIWGMEKAYMCSGELTMRLFLLIFDLCLNITIISNTIFFLYHVSQIVKWCVTRNASAK